jgi:hypothetical protein
MAMANTSIRLSTPPPRRANQGNLSGITRGEVSHLNGVPHGIDIGIRRLQVVVHANAAARARLQTGLDCELVFRPNADAQYDDLCGQRTSRFERDRQTD